MEEVYSLAVPPHDKRTKEVNMLPSRYATTLVAASSGGLLKMSNLVMFGDSYTDEGRLGYILNNNALPPAGKMLPVNNDTSVGGYIWGRIVANKTNARLYDYAVGGGMCSDKVTQHYLDNIKAPFLSIVDSQIPTFKTDLSYKDLYPDLTADNTVYTVWIGTNDLGIDGFLGDKQIQGATISDFAEAVWEAFDNIYKLGGRQFVLFNVAPLHLSPMYASTSNGGTGNNSYWKDKATFNTTEFQNKMEQYLTSANTMFATGAPFNLLVKRRWPGAKIALFDVNSLFMDMRSNPTAYLTEPANVTGSWRGCGDAGCYQSTEPRSSFMWYDEVHISGRASGHVAEHFIDVVNGKSKYGTYYRS